MLNFKKHIFRSFCILFLLLIAACTIQPRIWVEELPQYDALFERQTGWTGADGAYSVALADDEILWLFGDTWYGEVRQGRHMDAVIIKNSIAIQQGRMPPGASVQFYTGLSPDGSPRAFVQPDDHHGWFWIYDGIRVGKELYLFLVQLERTADRKSFGFKIVGSYLGHVANPGDVPANWRLARYRIPWGRFSAAGDTLFGSSLLKADRHIYIYGTTEVVDGDIRRKSMILARVPETELDRFDRWRFFSAGEWSTDFKKSSGLCSDMANEFSVSYLPALGKYIVVYTEKGFSKNIAMRFAPDPWGPWSAPRRIYACPEAVRNQDVFCYAAKGHPDLSSAPDEIIITYVANSLDFAKVAADATLYRPRFLRVRFAKRARIE
jgi:hypothetical protein